MCLLCINDFACVFLGNSFYLLSVYNVLGFLISFFMEYDCYNDNVSAYFCLDLGAFFLFGCFCYVFYLRGEGEGSFYIREI